MKSIKKGISQTIVLDQSLGPSKTIFLTILGEDGKPIINSSNQPISNLTVSTYSNNNYSIAITIHQDVPEQFIRLYWFGDSEISNDKYPEDAKLEFAAGIGLQEGQAEIVPVQYFIDYVLAADSKLEPGYKKAIDNYIKDKTGIKSFLKSAQDDLEKETELYFTERELFEKRDNFFDEFPTHLWQLQVLYPPINELVKFELKFNETTVVDVDISLFTFDKNFGLIEFLPVPGGDSSALYTLLLKNASGLAVSLLAGGAFRRIPNMFHVTYKTGLFTPTADPIEKEGIRKAICRRAYMDLLPIIDPAGRSNSMSESIDGSSASKSFRIDQVVKDLKEEEKNFVKRVQKKYGKTFSLGVA